MPATGMISSDQVVPYSDDLMIPAVDTSRARGSRNVRLTASSLVGQATKITTINNTATGEFFEDKGARVHRFNDRSFHGVATLNDGFTQGGGATADWFSKGTGVSAGLSWVNFLATQALVTMNGTVGYAAASRASDVDAALGTTQISIPFVGVAIMDRTGSGPPYWTSYGGYLEARMEPVSKDVGTVIGLEIDAINFGDNMTPSTPWRRQTTGGATALWLASGGDPANHGRTIKPAQLALGVVNNGETFMSGIVFANDAIEGTDGTTGFGEAVSMATRHLLAWYAEGGDAGERVNYITSTSATPGHSLQFQTGGTLYVSAGGEIDWSVSNVADSVNGMGVVPAIAGQAPYLHTFGDDSSVPMALKPKDRAPIRAFSDIHAFMADDGNQLAYLSNEITSNTYETGWVFTNNGPYVYGRGNIVVAFNMVAAGVNRLEITNAATGARPKVAAVGADTHVDVEIDPQGAEGTVKLNVPTATSATAGGASALPALPAGYFKVRDEAGTLVGVPYYNL